MASGRIARLVPGKGFGFIKEDTRDGSGDLFFHRSSLANTTFDALREGDSVTFDVSRGQKGPRAENVFVTSA